MNRDSKSLKCLLRKNGMEKKKKKNNGRALGRYC